MRRVQIYFSADSTISMDCYSCVSDSEENLVIKDKDAEPVAVFRPDGWVAWRYLPA